VHKKEQWLPASSIGLHHCFGINLTESRPPERFGMLLRQLCEDLRYCTPTYLLLVHVSKKVHFSAAK
jgi:hypothetical protein